MLRSDRPTPAGIRTLVSRLALPAAGAGIVVAAVLALVDRPGPAGAAAAAAGLLLLVGRASAGRAGLTADRLVGSFLDRTFDAGILGAIAWMARGQEPATSVGALVALVLGFLAAYARARGGALGYGVDESALTAALRYSLVAIGLGLGWLPWTVWAVAGVSALALAVRTSQVAKEERG